jgi:hypothetical protein
MLWLLLTASLLTSILFYIAAASLVGLDYTSCRDYCPNCEVRHEDNICANPFLGNPNCCLRLCSNGAWPCKLCEPSKYLSPNPVSHLLTVILLFHPYSYIFRRRIGQTVILLPLTWVLRTAASFASSSRLSGKYSSYTTFPCANHIPGVERGLD